MLEFNAPSWYTNFASGFSHLPFGSIAASNYAGNAGMINPFANTQTNQQNFILEPASFHPQFINLAPLISQVQASGNIVDNIPQNVVGTLPPPSAEEMNPNNYSAIESFFSGAWLADLSTKFFLIMLATVLLIMGLYFLAKSTDTGQIAIGVAKDAALAA